MAAALALLTSVLWGVGDFLGGTVSRRLSAYAVYFGSQVVAFVLFAAVATLTGAWAYAGSTLPWSPVAALLGGSDGLSTRHVPLLKRRSNSNPSITPVRSVVARCIRIARSEPPSSGVLGG